MLETVKGYWEQGQAIALEWLTSPAAIAQFGLLVGAFLVAVFINRLLQPKLQRLIDPLDGEGRIAVARRFVLQFLPLLLPLLAYALLAGGEQVTRSLFGSGAVVAFGKRVFIFLAVRILVRDIFTAPFLKTIGKFAFIPMAALYALGILDPAQAWMAETVVGVGDLPPENLRPSPLKCSSTASHFCCLSMCWGSIFPHLRSYRVRLVLVSVLVCKKLRPISFRALFCC